MNESLRSPLHRHVSRVSRRLFLQSFLDALMWCCAVALVLAAGWFFLQPRVLESPPDWLRWAVAGGLVVGAMVLTTVLAGLRSPDQVAAALLLDERFGLRERVTTSLMMSPAEHSSAAGQALLEDVKQRVAHLDVGSRFPVRLSWTAALVPLGGVLLAAVAIFYHPSESQALPVGDEQRLLTEAERAPVEDKFKEMQKKARESKPPDQPKSDKLQQLEDELDKIASRPRATKEELNERLKELTALEDELRKQEKQLTEKENAVKDQLKQLDRLAKKSKEDGPAKDLEKALAEGDLGKAKEEADRLSKKMKDEQLTKEEKQELKEQLHDLQNQLERLSRQKDEEERLKDLANKGEINPEALDRELDRLKENEEKLKDLQDVAEQVKKAEEALAKGEDKEAAESLEKAGEKLDKMDRECQE